MAENPKDSMSAYAGWQQPTTLGSQENVLQFIVSQILGRISTAKLVKVVSVTNAGEVAAVGFVDVTPLVNQQDQDGTSEEHGTVHGLPYIRIQGGENAVILDPEVGDIGLAVICDRDISSVKKNKDRSNPGSFRRFDAADGVYIGGAINKVPKNYIQFEHEKITMSPDNGETKIIMTPKLIRLVSEEIQIHTTKKLKLDTYGMGSIWTYNEGVWSIDNYFNGITPSNNPPHPPEVP